LCSARGGRWNSSGGARSSAPEIASAVREHFSLRSGNTSREMRELFRTGRLSLLVGFIILSICLLLGLFFAQSLVKVPCQTSSGRPSSYSDGSPSGNHPIYSFMLGLHLPGVERSFAGLRGPMLQSRRALLVELSPSAGRRFGRTKRPDRSKHAETDVGKPVLPLLH
jgi:hypothetical protein